MRLSRIPCKSAGMHVEHRPTCPTHPRPSDYHPFDPWYRDVNLIMDAAQMRPPASPHHASLAPRGSYISAIDPNLYIGPDAKHIFLFYSRTAYRNWVWDAQLEKYIEESNILAVQLSTDWWNDAEAQTMPRIIDAEVDRRASEAEPLLHNITAYNGTGQIGYPPRKECVSVMGVCLPSV